MKPKNRAKKLAVRQQAWESMSAQHGTDKKKTIHKPSGGVLEFTKPGSYKK